MQDWHPMHAMLPDLHPEHLFSAAGSIFMALAAPIVRLQQSCDHPAWYGNGRMLHARHAIMLNQTSPA